METEIIIRKCREEDVEETGEFYDRIVDSLDKRNENRARWIYKVYPSKAYVEEMTNKGCQYICLINGRIVATFALDDDAEESYLTGPWKEDLPKGSYMVLHALAVDPDIQKQGVGKASVQFCIDTARNLGYKAIRAGIVPDNIASAKLFEKNGFDLAGIMKLNYAYGDIPEFSMYEKIL